MNNQNFKNHGRYIPLWHFITPALLLAILVFSIVNFIHADAQLHYSSVLLMAISVILFIFWWYIRSFALKAQDRAIRAEENFRHYVLTGKPHDRRLKLSQVIALRFADDDEFVELCKKAANDNLTQKEIKAAIVKWKADHKRV